MPKFKIKAFAIDSFEQEIEAPTLEEAQEIFLQKQDAGEFEFDELVIFEEEDGFEVLDEMFNSD